MKTANVAAAKNDLSRLLRRVRRGETIIITDRNRPVARLLPISPNEQPGAAELDALVASGLLTPPAGTALNLEVFLATPLPKLPPATSLTAALLAEREESR